MTYARGVAAAEVEKTKIAKTDINDFRYIACTSQNLAHRTKGAQRSCVNCSEEEGLNGTLNV